ncbi:MAG: WecB/TagA/CpsF family glycosyltransferase [Planctomycetota bacterium]
MIPPLSAAAPESELDGIRITRLGFDGCLTRLRRWMSEDRFRRVATANADFLTQAKRHRELHLALETADMVTADGQPLVWLSRLAGTPVEERVAGSDLVLPLIAHAARTGTSVYLLGATDDVLRIVRQRFLAEHPGLEVAGVFSGRVDVDDATGMRRLAKRIELSGAGLLLVALGCPKQELFLLRYGPATGASLGIGVGASLDFLAGRSTRAPRWVQRLGLEWTHRLACEPRRLGKRYARNFAYLLRLTTSLMRRRLLGARAHLSTSRGTL